MKPNLGLSLTFDVGKSEIMHEIRRDFLSILSSNLICRSLSYSVTLTGKGLIGIGLHFSDPNFSRFVTIKLALQTDDIETGDRQQLMTIAKKQAKSTAVIIKTNSVPSLPARCTRSPPKSAISPHNPTNSHENLIPNPNPTSCPTPCRKALTTIRL